MKQWIHIQTYDEYCDFDKELYSMPGEGNTSVDMRLTFNVERGECYYHVITHNNDGNTRELGDTEHIPWTVGIAMLKADGIELPKKLTDTY